MHKLILIRTGLKIETLMFVEGTSSSFLDLMRNIIKIYTPFSGRWRVLAGWYRLITSMSNNLSQFANLELEVHLDANVAAGVMQVFNLTDNLPNVSIGFWGIALRRFIKKNKSSFYYKFTLWDRVVLDWGSFLPTKVAPFWWNWGTGSGLRLCRVLHSLNSKKMGPKPSFELC